MAGCDERFPKYLWCQLIPQAVITLNMLRQSRINPKLSAHDQVFGTFNYQRTPLAPLGTKVIIHERPDQRKTWDKHGLPGFMVNRAKDHFRSWQISVTSTGATRVSNAIELLPSKYTMPKTSSNDRIKVAFEEIAEALNNPKFREGFLNGNKENEILNELVEIFDKRRTESHNNSVVELLRVEAL